MTTKEKILEKLNQNIGIAVSGEELAELCGVSRAAVWKAVTSLRNEGLEISGTTNGGYILANQGDIFSREAFLSFYQKRFPEYAENYVECFKEIDSTNSYANRLLSENRNLRDENQELTEVGKKMHQAVIVAEAQTAGRGRSGRTFVSPGKTGIYLSLIYVPKGGITAPARITAFSAVAICRVLKRLYNIEPSIKWINDIFYKGKKISGILTEGIASFETGTIEAAIIGIGINIESNSEVFTGELSKVAGSILSDSNEKNSVSRAQLAAEIAGEVLTVLKEEPSALIKEYKDLSFIIGKDIEVHRIIDSSKGIFKAKAVDIDEDAALIVQTEDGKTEKLISGEVSLKSESFSSN